MDSVKLKSNRTGDTYAAQVYEVEQDSGKTLVITHRSLEEIFWSLPDDDRPSFDVQPFDLEKMPGIPPMFAVKCKLEKDGVCVEQIGELLCMDWQNKSTISKQFPLTICKNQAFDRAFIRYMQFDISMYETASILYSSSEIDVPNDAVVPVTSKTLDNKQSYSIPSNEWSGSEEADDEVNNTSAMKPAVDVKAAPAARLNADTVSDAIRNAMNAPENTSAKDSHGTSETSQMNKVASSVSADNRANALSERKQNAAAPQPVGRQTRQNAPVRNSVPQQNVPQKSKLRISKVANDPKYPRTFIQTEIGVLAFDPQQNIFYSKPGVNLDNVDLDDLYDQACRFVNMDLAKYANAR